MALTVTVTLNPTSIVPPQATQASVSVYNPGGAPVSVQNIQMQVTPTGSTSQALAGNWGVPPIGPGVVTLVPSLGTIVLGPFPLVAPSLASGSTFYQLGSTSGNEQPSQVLTQSIAVSALVYGSDGSVNQSPQTVFLVSWVPPPPIGTMGGSLVFSLPGNSLGVFGLGWP